MQRNEFTNLDTDISGKISISQNSSGSLPSAPLPPPYYESENKVSAVVASPNNQQDPADPQNPDDESNQVNAFMARLDPLFKQHKIPIALISKLKCLDNALMHFKVDDSGSMNRNSSVQVKNACTYMQKKFSAGSDNFYLTRWQEAEDRLHTLVEFLANIPTAPIRISAFDRPNKKGKFFELDRTGKTPESFMAEAHAKINDFFRVPPPNDGNTPILYNLQNMLREGIQAKKSGDDQAAALYILTDGEPSGTAIEIDQIKNLLKDRQNGRANFVTFLACSDDFRDYRWMHEIEEICCSPGNAGFVAAINDFQDEEQEVRRDQGAGFTYTKGLWLLCTLAAAMNPNDLDSLNEPEPLTKPTYDELRGLETTVDEYQYYFDNHPHGGNNRNGVFRPDYNLFLIARNTNTIDSVCVFKKRLAMRLSRDIDENDDDSEERELEDARQAVRDWRRNQNSNQSLFPSPPPSNFAIYMKVIIGCLGIAGGIILAAVFHLSTVGLAVGLFSLGLFASSCFDNRVTTDLQRSTNRPNFN